MLELFLPIGFQNARQVCKNSVRAFVPLAIKTAKVAFLS